MTLNEYLDNVDYSWIGYKPTIESLMFANFVNMVNADRGGEENETPIAHLHLLDTIFSKTKRHAVCAHRGFAKTTLLMEYMFLYLAVMGGKFPKFNRKVNVMMFVVNAMEKGGSDIKRNIEHRYKNSSFLQEELPKFSATEGRIYAMNKDGDEVAARIFGARTGVRGFKEFGERPKLAIIDDIIKDNELSEPFMNRMTDLIDKGVVNAMHPSTNKIIFIGTPFMEGDPLVKKIENPYWKSSVYPVAEKFPCKKDEFRSSWPDRFDFDYVLDQYKSLKADGNEYAFYQELMLRIGSDEQRLIEDISYIEPPQKEACNFYFTTDFATGGSKKNDFSVISVWAATKDEKIVLVDGICKRQTMDKNIEDLFYFASQYRPIQVGLEVSGAQQGFMTWIQQEMIKKGIFFQIKEVRPMKDKFSRFYDALPMLKSGKVQFSTKLDKDFVLELEKEIEKVTIRGFRSEHDDVLDTISMLLNLEIVYPSIVKIQGNVTDDDFEYDDEIGDFYD